jgi:hypothetical protein
MFKKGGKVEIIGSAVGQFNRNIGPQVNNFKNSAL